MCGAPNTIFDVSFFISWDFFYQHAAFKLAQLLALVPLHLSMTERNQPTAPACPHCLAAMQLVRHIEHLKELPDFYIFYCARCRYVETVKDERAA